MARSRCSHVRRQVCLTVSRPWSWFASVLASFLANSFNLTATSLRLLEKSIFPLQLCQILAALQPGFDFGLTVLSLIGPVRGTCLPLETK